MKKVLVFAAIAEAVTGLALLIIPSLVGQLLLGQQPVGVAIPVARVTGIALIALGISCWPATQLIGMFAYSSVVTLYLAYVGSVGEFSGVLLWPAAVVHAILSFLLGRARWLLRRAASSVGFWPGPPLWCRAHIRPQTGSAVAATIRSAVAVD
jgi:hypothetical protein